jgi:hypothetical protein
MEARRQVGDDGSVADPACADCKTPSESDGDTVAVT